MKSKNYEEFVEKFKPKLTTDDCYTPAPVYEAVKGWVCKEYGVCESDIVRPFWPGADYQRVDYPKGCVVLDNPPFSIISKICEFYLDHGIKFFLFAPSLTLLSGKRLCMRVNHLVCDSTIVYENGAKIKTAFVTNLGDRSTVLQTAPELGKIVSEAVNSIDSQKKRTVPKYVYPDHVVTAVMAQKYARNGIDFRVSRNECMFVASLDSQKSEHKAIYGGLLLSDLAAERRAAAERAAKKKTGAIVWELSEREKRLVEKMN